jgi:mRNA interferase RelE/StbE
MAYRIVLSEDAVLELEGLDKISRNRIIKKLKLIAENPIQAFKHLSGRKEYKLRVGNHRLIAMILHNEKTVFIIAIGHRKDIYKNLI